MAQTPEGKVKAFVRKRMRLEFPGLWEYSPPGGAFGRAGIPDLFFLVEKVFIVIETKAEGNTPTKLQMKQLTHLAEQGAVAAIITGRDTRKMDLIISTIRTEIRIRAARKKEMDQ